MDAVWRCFLEINLHFVVIRTPFLRSVVHLVGISASLTSPPTRAALREKPSQCSARRRKAGASMLAPTAHIYTADEMMQTLGDLGVQTLELPEALRSPLYARSNSLKVPRSIVAPRPQAPVLTSVYTATSRSRSPWLASDSDSDASEPRLRAQKRHMPSADRTHISAVPSWMAVRW